jgi:integrase
MATKSKHPGVYPRGRRFAYTWRDKDGVQRWGSEATREEAWRSKSRRDGSRRSADAETVVEYARDWIKRYPGRTTAGISKETREDYGRDLERHVLPFWGSRLRLVDLDPRDISDLVQHLAEKDLADATIKKVLAPLKAMLLTAVAERAIPTSPATGVVLPVRPKIEEDDEQPTKSLTDEQLDRLLAAADPAWLCLLLVLALAGLRISEALALRWKDVTFEGDAPELRVRRRWRKGAFAPPKSKWGKREVPLAPDLAAALADRYAEQGGEPDDLVFPGPEGQPLCAETILNEACKGPAEKAGVPWATFHALRHTCATRLFAAGRTAVQVQRWLGHHDPAFTVRTYVGLHNDDIGKPLGRPMSVA